ncbi:hypothetical protein F4780DRAFT_790589 [Xylariomycetidae sp. FL0641]|nr:hypothetical protein F4780DRAFT_790589 [Xylariomycetidae sp. FL0641]
MSTTFILSPINTTDFIQYDGAIEHRHASIQTPAPSVATTISNHLTWSTLWFSLLCIIVAFNIKNVPFMWHMRLLNAFRFILRTQRPSVPLGPEHIFQPIITTSSAQLRELDFNIHKSNSSYFSDIDIARTHLVCTLFAKGIEQMRGGTAAYTGSKKPLFGLALGAVSCNFKKEIRPYEEYEMWSKILSWDEKWVYIVTHFARKDKVEPKSYSLYPQQSATRGAAAADTSAQDTESATEETPEKHIYATALSKCVFKSGRKTVSPELMLQMSGLLPTAEGAEKPDAVLAEVESQRQKGLATAHILGAQNQQKLEAEFAGPECEALGRHTDGAGIVGVVNTLMQLAHIKKSQVL